MQTLTCARSGEVYRDFGKKTSLNISLLFIIFLSLHTYRERLRDWAR